MTDYGTNARFNYIDPERFTTPEAARAADSGTLLIALQPLVEIYFSGMVGLLCASLFGDRILSLALAGFFVLCYWAIWIAGILVLSAADLDRLTPTQMAALMSLPLLLPLLVGYGAQRFAEKKLS